MIGCWPGGLAEDVFDVVGTDALMGQGLLDGVEEGLGAVTVFERERLADILE